MKVALLTAALLAAFALSTTAMLAGSSGTGMTDAFAVKATTIVADITAGNFADVVAQFDPTVSGQLSEAQLANAWRTYQELLGTFQSAGQPTSVMRGDLTVEQIPIQLANSTGEIRITFHPDGTIAGLFFLRSGVPVP